MAATFFEQALLAQIVSAIHAVHLDAILIGNAAAALQGAPVTTRDIDFFVRDSPATAKKIMLLAARLGGLAVTRPAEPLSRMVRLIGMPVEIDFTFALSSRARFESVRSRAASISLASRGMSVRAASLPDIIAAKKAAGRPKDRAVLPILEQTARVKDVMTKRRRPRKAK
jgi:hypothetical protein